MLINMVIVNCDGVLIEYEWNSKEQFLTDMRSNKEAIPMLDAHMHTLCHDGNCYNETQLEEMGLGTVNDFFVHLSALQIAEWITETGLEHTTNGSYYSYFEEIADEFKISESWVKEHVKDIENCFDFDIVAECDIDDESFGMTFYLHYCCEHCGTYTEGKRCYEECSGCDCWCDSMEEDDE